MSTGNEFESLFTLYIDDMFALAIRLTRSKPNAEDLVQDLFVKISTDQYKHREIHNPKAWLASILYRLFIDRWRRDTNGPIQRVADNADTINGVLCHHPGPLRQLELSQEQQKIQRAMDNLNEQQYRIVLLHDMEGYTYDEIAGMMDIPVGTVKSSLHRARDKLHLELHDKQVVNTIRRPNQLTANIE